MKNIGFKSKIAGIAVLVVLGIIVVLQNTETVETRLLFATVSMPRAVLLLLAVAAGFVLGLLVALAVSRQRRKAE